VRLRFEEFGKSNGLIGVPKQIIDLRHGFDPLKEIGGHRPATPRAGLSCFANPGNAPSDLLIDPTFSTPLCETDLLARERFPDRNSFGCRLVQLLSPFDSHAISYKRTLWSWLAA
jgi:hypothetical protein